MRFVVFIVTQNLNCLREAALSSFYDFKDIMGRS